MIWGGKFDDDFGISVIYNKLVNKPYANTSSMSLHPHHPSISIPRPSLPSPLHLSIHPFPLQPQSQNNLLRNPTNWHPPSRQLPWCSQELGFSSTYAPFILENILQYR